MRRILSSIFIGLILGLLTWLFNWLTNGNGYITYVPITMGEAVIGYMDHLFDPLMYVVLVFFFNVGFGIGNTKDNVEAPFGYSFISMCLVVPALLSMLATFLVGARISFIVAGYLFLIFGILAIAAYVVSEFIESTKHFGDNP